MMILRPLLQLLLRAGWAPVAVLIFHRIIYFTPYRQPLDFVMHYSGGVAIAYFLWHALDCFASWFGTLTSFGKHVFTFAMACTVGLFWEFMELAMDVIYHTRIQHNIHETMRDLIADATGALTTLALLFVAGYLRKRTAG